MSTLLENKVAADGSSNSATDAQTVVTGPEPEQHHQEDQLATDMERSSGDGAAAAQNPPDGSGVADEVPARN